MKFTNTRGLSFEETLHYMDLGLIEGMELPTDFVTDIDSRIQNAFNLGHEQASEEYERSLDEAYDDGYYDGRMESEDDEWGS